MKSKSNIYGILKHFLCGILSTVLLLSLTFVPSINPLLAAAETDTVPSVYVKRTKYNPHFVQKVYLEPETEYVFSYLYSNHPASVEKAVYAVNDIDNHRFVMQQRSYSSDENRISRSFTTVSLDTEGITRGTGSNSGKIESYVGIQMYANCSDEYLNGESLYGGFLLYKKSDGSKTNLFTDAQFNSIAWQQNANARWTSLPPSSTDFAALNFAKYDADKHTEGVQYPERKIYSCLMADKTFELKSINRGRLVQSLWLKPDTEYVFSYYYDKAPASFAAVLKNSYAEYSVSTPIFDSKLKKISYEFTTDSLTADGVIAGTNDNSGYLKTQVGIKFKTGAEYLVGGNYSDFVLCEKGDTSNQNLLDDTRFTSVGKEGNAVWHSGAGGADAKDSIEKNTSISPDAFIKGYFIGAKDVIGGKIEYSKSFAYFGEKITVKAIPEKGYTLAEGSLKAGEQVLTAENGVYSFTCPNGDVVLSAEFTDNSANRNVSAITVKKVVNSPYFAQTVWLEPNTEYVFSYLFSKAPASSDVFIKANGNKEISFELTNRVLSTKQKKVTCVFNTGSLDDPNIIVGEGENAGKVKAYVGIRLYDKNTAVIGSYYADFTLHKKSDTSEENLFKDTEYKSIGARDSGFTWHGAAWNTGIINNFGRASLEGLNLFDNDISYSVSAKATDYGTVYTPNSSIMAGNPVNIIGIPNKYYRLSGVHLSTGEIIPTLNGAASFTMPNQNIEVSGIFKTVVVADCTGDDEVNVKDLIRIKKYNSGTYRDVVYENADCNRDGVINAQDMAIVGRTLLGDIYGVDLIPITGGEINNTFNGAASASADALRESILNAEDRLSVSGDTYYVSENGNDNYNGRTKGTPIKTFEKLKTLDLKEGDGVLFERGSTFRLSFQYYCVKGVSYGAYGEGEKPKIYGSEKNYADSSLWSKTDNGNIWRLSLSKYNASQSVYADAGLIVFNDGEAVGTKQMNITALRGNGYFCYDASKQNIYLYCNNGNPGQVYNDIEIGRRGGILKLEDNVKIDNLCLKYTGGHGIGGSGIDGAKVTNCEIGFIGGSSHYDTRYGNGIEIYDGCTNTEISNCLVYQAFDAGITFQGDNEEASYTNISFNNNLIEYCSWSIEWWSGWEKSTIYGFQICDIAPISNISFDSNICRLEGYGWSGITRNPGSIQGPHGVRTYKNLSNFTVTNNIFDCPKGKFFTWIQADEKVVGEQAGFALSGNTYYYYPTAENKVFEFGTAGATYAENQAELEKAVGLFDKKPLHTVWLTK